MECIRCHGFMVKERLYDLLENDGQVYALDGDGLIAASPVATSPAG